MKNRVILQTLVLLTITNICWPNSENQLAEENAELRSRVQNLEEDVEKLKEALVQKTETSTSKPSPDSDKDSESKKVVWSNLDVQIYGFIKADASYDSSRTTPGNYVVWVNSEAMNKSDNEFNLTANETRLGMRINGPQDDHFHAAGRIEFDFYGSNAAENKAKIQMRHAYLQMDWPNRHLSILAGQTSDVFSPLNPSTLNYTVLWDAGNIGYRRPQIRLTKDMTLDSDIKLELQGAVARTIGTTSAITGSESGEDAGFPSVQGRVGLNFPWLNDKPTKVGLSGHWGEEEYDIATSGAHKKFHSWSVNLDIEQPINDWLNIKGELFSGENLNTYFGGIGQGIRPIKDANGVTINHGNEITSKGGWVAIGLGPWDNWCFNIGAGIDDVDAADVNVGDRVLNCCVFGNAIYAFNEHAKVGFELSHWRTEYRGPGDADSLRAQASFIYSFQ